jgi:hypothetical protein
MFMCNFLAAGATVAIVQITIDFTGVPPYPAGFPCSYRKDCVLLHNNRSSAGHW